LGLRWYVFHFLCLFLDSFHFPLIVSTLFSFSSPPLSLLLHRTSVLLRRSSRLLTATTRRAVLPSPPADWHRLSLSTTETDFALLTDQSGYGKFRECFLHSLHPPPTCSIVHCEYSGFPLHLSLTDALLPQPRSCGERQTLKSRSFVPATRRTAVSRAAWLVSPISRRVGTSCFLLPPSFDEADTTSRLQVDGLEHVEGLGSFVAYLDVVLLIGFLLSLLSGRAIVQARESTSTVPLRKVKWGAWRC
jgi:hypothetical protein